MRDRTNYADRRVDSPSNEESQSGNLVGSREFYARIMP